MATTTETRRPDSADVVELDAVDIFLADVLKGRRKTSYAYLLALTAHASAEMSKSDSRLRGGL